MKYLIVDYHGHEVPILFDEFLNHVDMVPKDSKVLSAGSVTKSGRAFGWSTSLGIAARPGPDTTIIQLLLAGYDGLDAANVKSIVQLACDKLNMGRTKSSRQPNAGPEFPPKPEPPAKPPVKPNPERMARIEELPVSAAEQSLWKTTTSATEEPEAE